MEKHIDADQEAGKQFYLDFHDKGKIVMMNLLKFKNVADYSKHKELESSQKITGREAYQIYMDSVLPDLEAAGSKIIFYGKSNHFLIGPKNESWDAVLLVEHNSVAKFMEFATNKPYLKNTGHREAALEDSRLLPITQNKKYEG